MARPSTFDNFPLELRCDYGPYMGVIDKWHDGDTPLVDLDPGFDEGPARWIRLEGVFAGELHEEDGPILLAFVKHEFPPPLCVRVHTAKAPRSGSQVRSFDRYVGQLWTLSAETREVVNINSLINLEILRLAKLRLST